MTTTLEIPKKCALCGEISKHIELTSTNTFGPSDLDTRPPEMKRSTIQWWIERCPSCGYCAPYISEQLTEAPEVIKSKSYQEQLKNPNFPELVNSFLCWSLIKEKCNDFVDAGWSAVHAAWGCDDERRDESAQECRKKAITLFQKAKEREQSFMRNKTDEKVLLVDLFRRSGQFEEALKICDDELKEESKESVSKLLQLIFQFQKTLISNSDTGCHNMGEVPTEDK